MAYRGMVVDIPLGLGGFDGNSNPYQVAHTNLAEAKNVVFSSDSIAKAPGFAKFDPNGISSTAICLGGHEWRPTQALRYQVTAWDNGEIYRSGTTDLDATTLLTGATFTQPVHFVTGGHLSSGAPKSLYMFSKNVRPQQLNGTATSFTNLTNDSGDWSANYPGGAIYHDARIYAFDVDNDPHNYYASALMDHGDFSLDLKSGGRVMSIFPGEGDYISAMQSYSGTIMYAFKYPYGVYRVDTSNVTAFHLQVERVRDDVGCAGSKAVIKVGTDIYFVSSNGRMYSLSALTPGADAPDADITAAFNVEGYIDENFDRTRHKWVTLQYDEKTQELYYFFTSIDSPNTVNNRCLVFNLRDKRVIKISKYEQGEYFNSAWRYTTSSNAQGLYVGGYGGNIFDIQSENKNVDGDAFTAEVETAESDLRWVDPRLQGRTKRFDYLELTVAPTGNYDLTATITVDGTKEVSRVINLSDGDAAFDTAVYDTATWAGSKVVKKRIPINMWGETISVKFANSGLNEDFKLIHMRLYFAPTGQKHEQT